MKHRIPRKVHVGRGYVVEVTLVPPTVLKEELEEDDLTADGAWLSELDADKQANGNRKAGRILISNRLSSEAKWDCYWHELLHAINDIMAFDRQYPVLA